MVAGMLAIGGIGLVASLLLGIASKIFYVAVDPTVLAITEALPGANCGACGFAGCSSCAKAIAKGRAKPDACQAGGADTAVAVAQILGVTIEVKEPDKARVGCRYNVEEADTKFIYDGAKDCRAATMLFNGSKVCEIGCLTLGTCVNACPFDALSIGPNGLPEVNEYLCTGCGTCESICPKGIIRLTSQTRRIQHLYTQDECTSPCQEDMCRLGKIGDPVNINHLKRFVADIEMNTNERITPYKAPETGKRVAIIGGGPSGLTCAYYLARLGHSPTIFEAMPKLGGMLRYGIPEYRLPKAILDWEIAGILEMGVEVKTSVSMGADFTIKSLTDDGFDAFFLGTGAWDTRSLGVEGEDLEGVLPGTHFLIDRGLEKETPIGDRVAIIGGGNTAIDAARTSWRLGAKEVTIIYRRSRKEMPANDIEIEEAGKEGVIFHYLAAPTRLMGKDGKLTHLEYLEMELGEPDESGRRRPVPKKGTETIIEVDNVINAIGQFPVTGFLKKDGVALSKRNTIEVTNPLTGETTKEGVFAGGDAVTGASIAVEAIGAGRRAARSIHLYLSGEEISVPERVITKKSILPDVEG